MSEGILNIKRSEKLGAKYFTIIVDDQKVGKLKYGEDFNLKLPTGRHSVFVKEPLMKSKKLRVNVEEELNTNISVGVSKLNFIITIILIAVITALFGFLFGVLIIVLIGLIPGLYFTIKEEDKSMGILEDDKYE